MVGDVRVQLGPWRASGSLEGSDSQFSPGHFRSFQPQALIVLLPEPRSQSMGKKSKLN